MTTTLTPSQAHSTRRLVPPHLFRSSFQAGGRSSAPNALPQVPRPPRPVRTVTPTVPPQLPPPGVRPVSTPLPPPMARRLQLLPGAIRTRYTCPTCGKAWGRKSGLNLHIHMIHTARPDRRRRAARISS